MTERKFPRFQHGYLLGIDIGTQSAKCVAISPAGDLRGTGQAGYVISAPHPGWAEQSPENWWTAAVQAVRAAVQSGGIEPESVRAIGVTGQMHGLVLIGKDLQPMRPAIIWMDRRSAEQADAILERTPADLLISVAGNHPSPGFAGVTLAWLSEHEPSALTQARAVLHPKDMIVLRLTGVLNSEPSDASATWLYDLTRNAWSPELAGLCHVPLNLLPPLRPSTSVVGELIPQAAEALGLPPGIPVVAGASDQGALLLGSGVITPGEGAITIATGGQITLVTDRPLIDPQLRLNTFCHALPDRWYTMGAILNGGIALRWWRNLLGGDQAWSYPDLLTAAEDISPGADGLVFLPYLAGERTPHMNPAASGAFIGLTLSHTPAHLTRAVLEGVAHAFRDCLQTLNALGPTPRHFVIGGGGARGRLWRQITADVLGCSVQRIEGEEHTAAGAALLAGIGVGLFADADEATTRFTRYGPVEYPNPAAHQVYDAAHHQFQALYRAIESARQGEIANHP